jgi:enoyl-CoA hydratase
MSSVFNYQTLKVRLEKATRSLHITLANENLENAITMETLFELESLLAWVTTKVEIHSIFIQSNSSFFSTGYNKKVLKKLTIEKLAKFTSKLQKINQAIMLLPQTVVMDIQMGAENIACELATACDIRIANRSCEIKFNHAQLGLIPCSGGIAQLTNVVGHANARNWLLTGAPIHHSKLTNSGYVFDSYTMDNRDETIQNLLSHIHNQAPVQRIQTKLGVTECVRAQIETMLEFEKQISKAAMITEDWKVENQDNKMPAKSIKEAVKLSLVKSEEDETPPQHLN